jgi:aspartyl-tRNA(Asn)/glutamyl-tRNA(Gln) amidotransferase subunit C
MSISLDDVRHVARLARVALSEAEAEEMRGKLNDILAQFEALQQVDTADAAPTAQVGGLTNVMREDEPLQSLGAQRVLANAPRAEDASIRVRAVLGE